VSRLRFASSCLCSSFQHFVIALCRSLAVCLTLKHTMQRYALTQGALAPHGLFVRVHHHLMRPIRPIAATALHCSAAYTRCSTWAVSGIGKPRLVACFHRSFFQHVALYDSGSPAAVPPSPSAANAGLRSLSTDSAIPYPPNSVSRGHGMSSLGASLRFVSLQLLICSPTDGSGPHLHTGPRGFLLRAYDGLRHPLRRRLSLRWQLGNSTRRDHTRYAWASHRCKAKGRNIKLQSTERTA